MKKLQLSLLLWWSSSGCAPCGGSGVFKHVHVVGATRSSSVLLKGSMQSPAFASFLSFQCKSYEILMRTLSFSAFSAALVIWKLFVRRKSKGRGEFITGHSKEEAVFRQLSFCSHLFNLNWWYFGEKLRNPNSPILSAKGKSQPGACFEISPSLSHKTRSC